MPEDEQPNPVQTAVLREMTPEQRWRVAEHLYWACRRHKAAFLQSLHPDWSREQVEEEVRRIFLNAQS